ncbi:hypothetical protein Leryth_009171 [Lithospermum erythrorhizon]|uniref:SKI-interacting protein SKIP SNW domain-containing protein n=1 Tax=Lithospermum erythrorhizon TaxID=34254 RepID=A0AAV3QFX1_LITER|nr:hypothetical protein Leryth_009171 [Lithospermum erythrorhizon]
MAELKQVLPPPKSLGATHYDHSSDPWFKQRYTASEAENIVNVRQPNTFISYKRPAADSGEVEINDNFAKLSEALYVAGQKAREASAIRNKLQKEMAIKEQQKKEMELITYIKVIKRYLPL